MPDSVGVEIIGGSKSFMPHNEVDLHKGYVWRGSERVSVASSSSVSYIIRPCGFVDPNTELNNWFVWSVYSPGPVLVEVFKSPTYSGGIDLSLQNGIICLDNNPLLVIKKGMTITNDGVSFDILESGNAEA